MYDYLSDPLSYGCRRCPFVVLAKNSLRSEASLVSYTRIVYSGRAWQSARRVRELRSACEHELQGCTVHRPQCFANTGVYGNVSRAFVITLGTFPIASMFCIQSGLHVCNDTRACTIMKPFIVSSQFTTSHTHRGRSPIVKLAAIFIPEVSELSTLYTGYYIASSSSLKMDTTTDLCPTD